MKRITAALLSCVILLAGCAKMEEPEFRKIENFGVRDFGLKEVTVAFSARYYNPNKFGMTIKDAGFDVYVDSSYLGKFIQSSSTQVGSRSEFAIPLEGKIGITDALKLDIPHLLGKEVFIRANGNVKVGKGGMYINKSINYQGKQRIDSDLIK